jgi:hypothetical protein
MTDNPKPCKAGLPFDIDSADCKSQQDETRGTCGACLFLRWLERMGKGWADE